MDRRRLAAVIALCALVLAPELAAADQGRLDLRVAPDDVRRWDDERPPHDLVGAPPARPSNEPSTKAPGWSLRPTADVDLAHDEGGGAEIGPEERTLDLGDVTLDLNSVGIRLQRTW